MESTAPEQKIFSENPHTFHIPVMGTGFTVDTPLNVARYGISSVVSIGDDILLEQMRKLHSERQGLPFEPIAHDADDARARRITAYLDLLQDLVDSQVDLLRQSPFEPGSEITRFFELLPDSPLKEAYGKMITTSDADTRKAQETVLRQQVRPGSIDVNIMTKVDFDVYRKGKKLPEDQSVALSAVRGFAKSKPNSAIVLSAGINRRLFAYMAGFDCFYPDETGQLAKTIILKVSDYRSAHLQGRLLAKRGLWVSEYRMESGLNCGGHAFATNGHLMGPILDEFRRNRVSLDEELRKVYRKALEARGLAPEASPPLTRLTVQGGIGTAAEDRLLLDYYQVNGTGWGTPFLLVPEVTNVDDVHLKKLQQAGDDDVELSHASPLGVRFWSLRTSTSEDGRRKRIEEGHPGSSCPKGYLKSNTEFGERPICPASTVYQKQKLSRLSSLSSARDQLAQAIDSVLAKSCLCRNLAGGALNKTGLEEGIEAAVCCGPNIVNFSKTFSLSQMVDHIYGRLSIMPKQDRPHMFIKELSLYVDFLKEELQSSSPGVVGRTAKYFTDFKNNLLVGIEHYREVAEQLQREQRAAFVRDLDALMAEIERCFGDVRPALGLQSPA